MSHLYKTSCHNDESNQIAYDQKFSAIAGNSNKSLTAFANVAKEHMECMEYVDQNSSYVTSQCNEYFNQLGIQIKELCPVINEDLWTI